MSERRPLGELLGELADCLTAFPANSGLQAQSLSLDLPIDVRLVSTADGLQLIGDVPLFLTRTDFDPTPARLAVEWHAVPVASVARGAP